MVGCREWQERTQDLELGGGASGVSRISARGVLKVRPHTKSGGGGRFRSDIRKVGGGRRFRSDIRKVGGGGGGGASGPIYEKWRGGGGGGGGPFRRFRSDTFGHTENIYMYLPRYTSHARANEHAGKG